MWVSIRPGDIAQAKQDLASRRAAILARHAGELQGLDEDAARIDELAGLVESFMRKFKPSAPEAGILVSRPRQPRSDRPSTSLEVAGFGREMLPIDPRLAPSGDVSIDFQRSNRRPVAGAQG